MKPILIVTYPQGMTNAARDDERAKLMEQAPGYLVVVLTNGGQAAIHRP